MDKKTLLITVVSVIAIFGFLYGAYAMTSQPAVTEFPELKSITEKDHVKWSKDKKNVLIEYSDLQCPACAQYHGLIKEVAKDEQITKNITFAYRHFPLDSIHVNARNGAFAAEAAANQGKFYEMHDVLFDKQKEWEFSEKPLEFFKKYATALKLDIAKFEKDFSSKEVEQRVQDDLLSGRDATVSSTPTFFLNGRKLVSPQSAEEFKQILIEEIGG